MSEDYAIARQIALPPALLEAIGKDPAAFTELTRSQLAVVNHRLVTLVMGMENPTVANLATVSDHLRKALSGREDVQSSGGTGFTVNIVVGDQPSARTEKILEGDFVDG